MVEKEKLLPIIYDDLKIENAYRIDLLVENIVVVELKSVSVLLDIHLSQTLTYMKLGGYKLGLLINFLPGWLDCLLVAGLIYAGFQRGWDVVKEDFIKFVKG